jgi:hypothetical protein
MMPLAQFKFKNARALVDFQELPSWDNIVSKIVKLYNIPFDQVNVTVVDNNGEMVDIDNDEALQSFFHSFPNPPELIKFSVHNQVSHDCECKLRSL